jgi:Ca-activated chloride channel family protein
MISVGAGPSDAPGKPTSRPATQPAQVKIDMDKAVPVELAVKEDLTPQAFTTRDGRSGWALRIPGNRPIATPAYADGKIFVGGGYGSHEFYAFDATTGKKVWQMTTADDGPTAAVVEDGCVAFNTESCTVIIADAKTGKVIWQEWLGDPLMSQPAIAKGRLYIAYPGGNPRGANKGEATGVPNAPAHAAANGPAGANQAAVPLEAPAKVALAGGGAAVGPATGHGHRLLCADLKTGRHIWEQDIAGDVISAPVVEGDQVFFTCFDGTSFALNCADGTVAWKKHNAGTSAPLVANGQVLVAQRQEVGKDVEEGVQRLDLKKGDAQEAKPLAAGKAEYLKEGNGGAVALSMPAQHAADASVGFANAPAAAGLGGAAKNANVSTVAGAWAYQGSRVAYAQGRILNAQANRFNCINAKDGTVAWQAEAVGKGVSEQVQAFSPPAVASGNLYVCSAQGHLIALDQKDGKVGFLYSTGQPMAFQPALAGGNIYAGTTNGMLICLKTGNPAVDGWTAWGGNAQHNKKE